MVNFFLKDYILEKSLAFDITAINLENDMPNWEISMTRPESSPFNEPLEEDMKCWIETNCFSAVLNEEEIMNYNPMNMRMIAVGSINSGANLLPEVVTKYGLVLNQRENEYSKLHKMNPRVHYFPVHLYTECQPSVDEIDQGGHGTVTDWPQSYVEHSRVEIGSGKLSERDFFVCPVRSSFSQYMLLILNVDKWELVILDPSNVPSLEFHLSASYFVVNSFTICVTSYLFLFMTALI